MNQNSCHCGICGNTTRPSLCSTCVNHRLNEYYCLLKSLSSHRDSLYCRLKELLVAKEKADKQKHHLILKADNISKLKERLHNNKEELIIGKSKIEKLSCDLKINYGMLDSATNSLARNRDERLGKLYPDLICTQNLGHAAIMSELLHKQSVIIRQLCKLFPLRRVSVESDKQANFAGQFDQICGARLPRGVDPHSVPSEELSASLGYLVQLLNLVVHNLAAPAMSNSGFAGSCSRIWQRDSYWNAYPSSRSNEYPLFIPRQSYCSSSGGNSWTDKSLSNYGVTSIGSSRSHTDSSSSYSHSMEAHKDLQKGISLLKKSVACVTAYCYHSICLEIPSDGSTVELFGKLLAALSSSKDIRSIISTKTPYSRACNQVQKLNKSLWNVNPAMSYALSESEFSPHSTRSSSDTSLANSTTSFLFVGDVNGSRKCESPHPLIEGWDLVERPAFPPPPSQSEDIEHWARAMILDANSN